MSSTALEFKAVSKHYANTPLAAVSTVDLRLEKGKTLALIGESGGGKSTLLRLAAGLETPDQGEVYIDNEPVATPTKWVPPEHRKIGLVFQDGALFPHLTVEANLAYGLNALASRQQKEHIAGFLERFRLSGKEKRYPHELSGGERQRLSVARALAPKPEILLLDEPFGSLDPALRRSLRDEIHSLLRHHGATVVLVTHDPEDALAVADKIAILRKGHIEQFDTTENVYTLPKNEYCAHLFGPANEIVGACQKPQWIRPEHLQILAQPVTGAIKAKVLRVRNIWKHQEVQVLPASHDENAERGKWLVYAPSAPKITEKSTIWIQIKKPSDAPSLSRSK